MSNQKPGGENPLSRIWRELRSSWSHLEKEGAALARGGPRARLIFLLLFIVLLFLCFLIFSTDLLGLNVGLLRQVQNARLTANPYTSTPKPTKTKKPTDTLTPTITLTPTGKQPSPTITPTFLTPTFTVTSTPTKPSVALVTLHPDSYYAWQERLTNPWIWRHFYALFIGTALATWLVVLYIREIYTIRRSIRSAGLLVRMLLMLPIGTLHIKGGNLVDIVIKREWIERKDQAVVQKNGKVVRKYKQVTKEEVRIVRKDWILATPNGKIVRKHDTPVKAGAIRRTLRLLRIGIPARLIVDEDSCVVIEGSQKQSLVVGPTSKPIIMLGFSRLRRAVDLRDAAVSLSLIQPTRDGVPLNVVDSQFIFCVYRGEPTVPDAKYLYNEEAIFNLVYRYWLDGEWLPEMTERIKAELHQFIARRDLSTFLPYISKSQSSTAMGNQAANPFNTFVSVFNAQAKERGIQIRWQGEGLWNLPTEADLTEQLENWQKDLEILLKLPEKFSDQPTGGEYNQALINLIQQVPIELLRTLFVTETDLWLGMRTVIAKYRNTLNDLLRLYHQRGQTPPDELVKIIEHLNRMILRR